MNITKYGEGGSPFDKIRCTDTDGKEYWRARDLMNPLGYDSWRRFEDAIDRAKAACSNSGQDVESNFAGAVKISATNRAADFHLSRYACYLVAMNGDPRKAEIAAAQCYFVTRTREAELATEARALPQDYKSALRELLDEVERAERLQEKVKALEPKAKFYDSVSVAINSQTVMEVAKLFGWGQNRFFNWLRSNGYLMTLGTNKNLPYQKHVEAGLFTLVEKSYKHAKSGEDVLYSRTLITGKGICYFHKKLTEAGIILPALEDMETESAA
jgi:phage antirepressor YoqD-like protein